MKKPAKAKEPSTKKKVETDQHYELWNLPEYGYIMLSHEKGEKVKLGTMLCCGKLTRRGGMVFMNYSEFAKLKGRMPKIVVPLQPTVSKEKLDLSLRNILAEEGLL